MEIANSLQTIIITAMEKFNIEQDGPLVCFQFKARTGRRLCALRGENSHLLGISESDAFDSWEGAPEFLIFTDGDTWIPFAYGKDGKDIDGADMSPDGTHLVNVKPRRWRKVAKKCEAWASDFIERNGLEDYTLDVRKSYIPISAE